MLSMLCEDALSIRIYDIFLGLESRRMMGSLPRGCNRTAASVFFFKIISLQSFKPHASFKETEGEERRGCFVYLDQVLARVGKGIIKTIKPSGVGFTVPPPQFTALFIYLFIHIPISVHEQNQTSEPHQKTSKFRFKSS
jgi:hypothetical protein